MSNVVIEKVSEGRPASRPSLLEDAAMTDRVRTRAFEFFLSRGKVDGFATDDWFRAERDIVSEPKADIIDKDGAFQLNVTVPGFDDKDLKVTALSRAVVIRGVSRHRHMEKDGSIHWCDLGEKKLFRRFDVPASICPNKVTATLDNGLLRITAPKAANALAKVAASSAAV